LARTRRYKRAEKNAVQTILRFFGRIGVGIGRGFSSLFHSCNRKLTIMIVPHSQNKVLNFQTNVFALISCAVIIAGVFFSFFWFNKTALSANAEIHAFRLKIKKHAPVLMNSATKTQTFFRLLKNFRVHYLKPFLCSV